MPAQPFVAVEREHRLLPLFRRQRGAGTSSRRRAIVADAIGGNWSTERRGGEKHDEREAAGEKGHGMRRILA